MKAATFLTRGAKAPMPRSFQQLTVLEPGLKELWDDAAYYAAFWRRHPAEAKRGLASSWVGIKGELARLVGPLRRDGDDILGSVSAYDCACRALLDALEA